MKKIFYSTIIFFSMIFLTGCSDKGIIFLKSEPFTSNNYTVYEYRFKKFQRIYYGLFLKDGFTDTAIKVEIIKKNTKSPSLGYSYVYGANLRVDKTKNYYTDYFTLSESGLYIMQIFELRRPDKCIARQDFWVD